MGGCGSGLEPAFIIRGSLVRFPLVCLLKCPWARHWTPNCSWCVGRHLAWLPLPSVNNCKSLWTKVSTKCILILNLWMCFCSTDMWYDTSGAFTHTQSHSKLRHTTLHNNVSKKLKCELSAVLCYQHTKVKSTEIIHSGQTERMSSPLFNWFFFILKRKQRNCKNMSHPISLLSYSFEFQGCENKTSHSELHISSPFNTLTLARSCPF